MRCVRVSVQVDASLSDVFDGHGWSAAESEKSMDGSQASDCANHRQTVSPRKNFPKK